MIFQPAERIAYRFFGLFILLLLLWCAAALYTQTLFIIPAAPIAFSYPQAAALAEGLRDWCALVGLTGAVLMLAARAGTLTKQERTLEIGWALAVTTTVLLLVYGLSGRLSLIPGAAFSGLPALNGAIALVTAAVALIPARQTVPTIWFQIGAGALAFCTLLSLGPVDVEGLATFAHLRLFLALPLMSLSAVGWLMHRISNLTPETIRRLLATLSSWIILAGLVSEPTLARSWTPVALLALPMCGITAAIGTRALRDRNPSATLAPQWFALTLLLWLILGLLLAIVRQPSLIISAGTTALAELPAFVVTLTAFSLVLACINQAAAELFGMNGRITGYLPFWCVAFGSIGFVLASAGAGIARIYSETVAGMPFISAQQQIAPLYAGALAAFWLFTLGVALYALAFWRRLPRSLPAESPIVEQAN